MTDRLDNILSELDRKAAFIMCIEHDYKFADEIIRITTVSMKYIFIYSFSNKNLRVYIDKEGVFHKDISIGKIDYETFDKIFMRYVEKMYNIYKGVAIIEDKKNKISKVYPIPNILWL